MNFLNDSFKTLKNVLEEKINFEETEDVEITQENEKLKQLCQHQLEEVMIHKSIASVLKKPSQMQITSKHIFQ
jgi:hypothetical protein